MNLPAPIAIAIRTLADWLDDRYTLVAIGLATGYFGMGDAQWGAISNWIVGTATLVLVLIPDPRKRAKNEHEIPPIDLVAGKDRPVRRDGAVAERGGIAADGLRQHITGYNDAHTSDSDSVRGDGSGEHGDANQRDGDFAKAPLVGGPVATNLAATPGAHMHDAGMDSLPRRSADGMRQSVPSNRDPEADTQPNRWESGFGNK